jgi:hypothetical protein
VFQVLSSGSDVPAPIQAQLLGLCVLEDSESVSVPLNSYWTIKASYTSSLRPHTLVA